MEKNNRDFCTELVPVPYRTILKIGLNNFLSENN